MSNTENPERKAVAVIGLGSIGGITAGLLAALDRYDILACVRRPIERLIVERADGTIDVAIPCLTDPAQAKPVDWVLVCTKTQDTPSSAPWLQRLCGPNTRVAALQNGITHAERLAPFVGHATVVPTIVYYNGERLAPDRVRYRRAGDYDFAVTDDPVLPGPWCFQSGVSRHQINFINGESTAESTGQPRKSLRSYRLCAI